MKPINCLNVAMAGLLGLGGLTSGSALANGPMIGAAQHCDMSIGIPKSVDDFYMSENCKNVYLVPKRGGDLDVIYPEYTISQQSCESIEELENDIRYYEKAKRKLMKQRERIMAGSWKYRQLTKQIAKETELLSEAKGTLRSELVDDQGRFKTGAYMKVHFQKTDSDKVVGDAILANRQLHQDGVKFKMVPVSESFLSIINPEVYKETIQTPLVVAAYLPLLEHEDASEKHFTYYFNGSAAGEVYLSAQKGCQMRREFGNNLNLVDPSRLNAYVTANQTYTVPLNTRVGYEAKIVMEHAVEDFLEFVQRKSKFKIQEFKDHVANSSSRESFSVDITFGEMSAPMRERLEEMGFFSDLIENVKTDMMERFLDTLESHTLLSIEEPQLTAPEAGIVKEPRVGYRCHTKKSWGGLKKSRNCGNYIYHVDVERDGFAQEVREVRSKVEVELDHSLSITDVIFRYHTSSMIELPENN